MKILYFITGLGIGGAETITLNLAAKMAAAGHEVAVVYLTGESQYKEAAYPGVRLIGLAMKKNIPGMIAAVWKTRQLLRKVDPDVVHGNMFHANLLVRTTRIFCRVRRLISTEHSKNIGSPIRMFLYRLTDHWSDVNTNVSEEATAYFIRQKAFSPSKSTTVYNGVDLRRFCKNDRTRAALRQRYGVDENDFLFLHVGRLTAAKDQKNLLDGFCLLAEKEKHVRLLIVGDGEKRQELQIYSSQLPVAEKIIWAGLQTNTEAYYNAADAFVLSSAWEGFGLVIAEAMACELPVIATDAGGCAEVVGNPAYIVGIQDPEALHRGMQRILRLSPHSRAALGHENRLLSERFELKRICNQWLKIYRG